MTTTNGPGRSAWVRIPEPVPEARVRLFCFPYAGGGISAFRGWSALLKPDVEVCLVQLPGREDRLSEPRVARLTALVPPLVAAVRPYLDPPFAFFGHSMGGLIAFELARGLRAGGGPVPFRLFIAARRAPQLPPTEAPLHMLPDASFIAEIRRRYDGIPKVIFDSPELLALLLPTLRSDLELCETYDYQPEPPLACPISAFGGLDDRMVARDELEAWCEQAGGGFALTRLPGDHFFLKSSRAALLTAVLADLAADALESQPRASQPSASRRPLADC